MTYNCKEFVLKIVTLSFNCLERITISYLKLNNRTQTNDYYQIEIFTWNHTIIRIRLE